MKNFDKDILTSLYLENKLNPYEIAEILNCNHKTVRKYLRLHNIPLRNSSEYNYLPRVSHKSPDKKILLSALSIAAHIAYLCEGWHRNNAGYYYFCNTDPVLVDMQLALLNKIYHVNRIKIYIVAKTESDAAMLLSLYPGSTFVKELNRKTPIVRIRSGGKALVREMIENAYFIASSIC
jgi:hypothetical protein